MCSVIRFAPLLFAPVGIVLAASCLDAPAAFAQVVPGPHTAGLPPPGRGKTEAPALPPPPAIPGAQSVPGSAAPADRTVTDMAPNAALFDAIDRGDITAARDALNRGADLNAQNVLGMTPIDLSIDLGRNDITFLLLSMRSGSDQAAPALTAARGPAPAVHREAAHRRRPAAVSAQVAVQAPAPPRTPPLFAHDGGTPVPQAGFLGFDPQSASR